MTTRGRRRRRRCGRGSVGDFPPWLELELTRHGDTASAEIVTLTLATRPRSRGVAAWQQEAWRGRGRPPWGP